MDKVYIWWSERAISGQYTSFHTPRKVMTTTATSAEVELGRMMRQSTENLLQPSTIGASS